MEEQQQDLLLSCSSTRIWARLYDELVTFQRKYGHCAVPQKQKFLRSWVRTQRENYRNNMLSKERTDLLDQLGFIWNVRSYVAEKNWDQQREKMVAFIQEHGHCRVPNRYKEDKSFGRWIGTQRRNHRMHELRKDRKDVLDQLGFVWSISGQDGNPHPPCHNLSAGVDDSGLLIDKDQDMASTEERQEQQASVELDFKIPKNQGLLSSRQEELPRNVDAGIVKYSVIFEPGSPLGLEFEPILSGNGCRVVSIQEGSQAWVSCKIHAGDTVSKLNGQVLSNLRYEAITYLLHRPQRQEVTFRSRPMALGGTGYNQSIGS
jgi:hypothetical protein